MVVAAMVVAARGHGTYHGSAIGSGPQNSGRGVPAGRSWNTPAKWEPHTSCATSPPSPTSTQNQPRRTSHSQQLTEALSRPGVSLLLSLPPFGSFWAAFSATFSVGVKWWGRRRNTHLQFKRHHLLYSALDWSYLLLQPNLTCRIPYRGIGNPIWRKVSRNSSTRTWQVPFERSGFAD